MKRLAYFLPLLLVAGCTFSPEGAPSVSEVTLRAFLDKDRRGESRLKLLGDCPFVGGTIVRVRLSRVMEEDHRGKLEATTEDWGGEFLVVDQGKFEYEQVLAGPAVMRVKVSLEDEFQGKSIQRVIAGKSTQANWNFEFTLFEDGFARDLLEALPEVQASVEGLRGLCAKVQLASRSDAEWNQYVKGMEAELLAVRLTMGFASFRRFYPAAHRNLSHAMTALSMASYCGAFNFLKGKWVIEPDGAPFDFVKTSEFIDRSLSVARREYGLHLVRAMRKAGRRDALLVLAARQGPAEAREIEGEDLDRAEARLRGEAGVDLDPLSPLLVERPDPAQRRVEEVRKLLAEADRLWERADDCESPALYKRLLKEYPTILEGLGARVRATHRAREDD